jgi:hypothetical protein
MRLASITTVMLILTGVVIAQDGADVMQMRVAVVAEDSTYAKRLAKIAAAQLKESEHLDYVTDQDKADLVMFLDCARVTKTKRDGTIYCYTRIVCKRTSKGLVFMHSDLSYGSDELAAGFARYEAELCGFARDIAKSRNVD